jgi:hypothetical protein
MINTMGIDPLNNKVCWWSFETGRYTMKKNDLLIILAGLILAGSIWFYMNRPMKDAGYGEAVIYQEGKEIKVVPLSQDDTITIMGDNGAVNIIRIQGGKANMIEASCPDQICVHTRPAEKDGQSVVCLPNRVVVEIRNTKKESIDGVSE